MLTCPILVDIYLKGVSKLTFIFQLAHSVQSSAVIKIRFKHYQNLKGLDYRGNRCDPYFSVFFKGEAACDPFFTIYLAIDRKLYRQWTTNAVRNKNQIMFTDKIINIKNPLVVPVDRFQGDLALIVQVDDADRFSTKDHIGTFSFRKTRLRSQSFRQPEVARQYQLTDNGQAKATLVIQISIRCDSDYYGSECNKYCRAANDSTNGYYECDFSGKKICANTYDPAADCKQTYCDRKPCRNGGRCTNLLKTYKCQCRGLFGGPTCSHKLSACETGTPCRNGGTCRPGIGHHHRCDCLPGFTGRFCDLDVDECALWRPCRGNGSRCKNLFGSYNCQCAPGWRGRNCTEDVNECAEPRLNSSSNVVSVGGCFNGGRCTNLPGSFSCRCPVGFNGTRCELDVDECVEEKPCRGNGSRCENLLGSYTCLCGDGWRGRNCTEDVDECARSNSSEVITTTCFNKGRCENLPGSFKCRCPVGFHGTRCELDVDECVEEKPCRGNGSRCLNVPGSYFCKCADGWRGRNCTEDVNECTDLGVGLADCLNGGKCKNLPGGYNCSCPSGFRGARCELDVNECVLLRPCRGKGSRCKNVFGSYNCQCAPGWRGRNCTEDVNECVELTVRNSSAVMKAGGCFNRGQCENLPGSFKCHCPLGFHGNQCELDIDECQSGLHSCNNKTQVCQNMNGTSTCLCRTGLIGPNCTELTALSHKQGHRPKTWYLALMLSLIVLLIMAGFAGFVFWRCLRNQASMLSAFSGLENPVYNVNEGSGMETIEYDYPRDPSDRSNGPNKEPPPRY